MSRKISSVISSLALILLPSFGSAAELDSKIGKIAKQFSSDIKAKKPTLAVLPFRVGENLAKKKVDFAVGEIFIKQLLSQDTFTLVERGDLTKILKEQKLSLSGLVDEEDAAAVGKTLGARYLVVGTVSRLGKSYQISARLVDVESAKLVHSGITEVRVSVFEEDAAGYLNLVPDEHAISLYIATTLGSHRPEGVNKASFSGNYGTIGNYTADVSGAFHIFGDNPDEDTMSLFAVGLGVRYKLSKKLQADVAYFLNAYEGDNFIISSSQGLNNSDPTNAALSPKGSMITVQGRYLHEFSPKSSVYFGPSLELYTVEFETLDPGNVGPMGSGGPQFFYMSELTNVNDSVILHGYFENSDDLSGLIPALGIHAGLELRPTPRININIKGQFNAWSAALPLTATFEVTESNTATLTQSIVDTQSVTLVELSAPMARAEVSAGVSF